MLNKKRLMIVIVIVCLFYSISALGYTGELY